MTFANNETQASSNAASASSQTKEWKLIEKLLQKSYNEQAKTRRWGIFFKLLTFAYLLFIVISLVPAFKGGKAVLTESHTAVIEVEGKISHDAPANADAIVKSLRKAFEAPNAKALLLKVNSPGGSPVESGFIYDEIDRLQAKHPNKKVYAAITDIGASGAYYIAAAADQIYADKASLVGSIGVISSGFGFTETMSKLGVERRSLTSGDNKAFLDPFSPLKESHVEHFSKVLGTVHQQFIDVVKQGRGDRLKSDDVFNGLIWTGHQAVELGLIDGLGSPGYIAREIVGEAKMVNYTVRQSPLEVLADKIALSFSNRFEAVLEHRGFR